MPANARNALNRPEGLAFDAQGTLWVGNNGEPTVSAYTAAQLVALGATVPAHQIDINTLWARTIKETVEQTDRTATTTTKMIVDKLGYMDKAAEERYDKMKITQELIDAVKDLKKQRGEK